MARELDRCAAGRLHSQSPMPATPKFQRILVPHDFGAPAESALAYALGLADKLGAQLTVLHAYEVPDYGFPDAIVASFEFASEVERRATNALQQIQTRTRGSNREVETMLRRGTPWAEIVGVAESLPADLIVMGTNGRTGMPRLLLGSVAEKVIRSAPCPVLTVHAAQAGSSP